MYKRAKYLNALCSLIHSPKFDMQQDSFQKKNDLGKLEQAFNQYFMHILSLVTDNNPS